MTFVTSRYGRKLCINNTKELNAIIEVLRNPDTIRFISDFEEINGKTFNEIGFFLINNVFDAKLVFNYFDPSTPLSIITRIFDLDVEENIVENFCQTEKDLIPDIDII